MFKLTWEEFSELCKRTGEYNLYAYQILLMFRIQEAADDEELEKLLNDGVYYGRTDSDKIRKPY